MGLISRVSSRTYRMANESAQTEESANLNSVILSQFNGTITQLKIQYDDLLTPKKSLFIIQTETNTTETVKASEHAVVTKLLVSINESVTKDQPLAEIKLGCPHRVLFN